MKKILMFVGSFRKSSYNQRLAEAIAAQLKGKADVSFAQEEELPYFCEDLEANPPKAVAELRKRVLAADGLWFVTPEYNHQIPGVTKNAIDWLSRQYGDEQPQVLDGKKAVVSGASLGGAGTQTAQDQLVSLLALLNVSVMMTNRLQIGAVYKIVDEKGGYSNFAKFIALQVADFLKFIGA